MSTNTRKIQGEDIFQVLAHSFCVSPSTSGYTLQYSADGIGFTSWDEPTPANEVLVVNGVAKMMYFKLLGNTGEVTVVY